MRSFSSHPISYTNVSTCYVSFVRRPCLNGTVTYQMHHLSSRCHDICQWPMDRHVEQKQKGVLNSSMFLNVNKQLFPLAEERAYNKESQDTNGKRNQDISIPSQRLPAPAWLHHDWDHLQLYQRQAHRDWNVLICYMPISWLALRDLWCAQDTCLNMLTTNTAVLNDLEMYRMWCISKSVIYLNTLNCFLIHQ